MSLRLLASLALTCPLALAPRAQFAPVALPGGHEVLGLTLTDVDADGDLDLACANFGTNRLLINDGRGGFTDVTGARFPADLDQTNAMAFADFDGDGDLDVFCANGGWPGGQNRLYLNDGSGRFTDATKGSLPADYDWANAVAAADFDGDGDVDLVCGNFNQNRFFSNDGSGVFIDETAARLPAVKDATMAIAAGDVDGDGDGDLVCGNGIYQQNRLWLNDGQGRFAEAPLPRDADDTLAVALGDVDGDGDLDLVYGNGKYGGQPNRLLLNDGRGAFRFAAFPDDRDETTAIALADLDGDADLDVFCANTGRRAGGRDRIYRNDGHGRFADATEVLLPNGAERSTAVAAGDVDGDLDIDVIVGHLELFGATIRLWVQAGPGASEGEEREGGARR